jgi:threonylcarbamoyladenosine tRNA methylthiotransferase MtaB
MIAEAARASKAFASRFVGQVLKVLWESLCETPDGRLWRGLSDNYVRVYTRDERDLRNSVTPVLTTEPFRDGLLARPTV